MSIDGTEQPWNSLSIDKVTGSSADQLLACGMAVLADIVLARANQSRRIYLRDAGPYYAVEISTPIIPAMLARLRPFSLFDPLRTAKNAAALEGLDCFDYEGERLHAETYRNARRALEPALRSPESAMAQRAQLQELIGSPPDERLPLYSAISGFKVVESANELARVWATLAPEPFVALVTAIFETFSQRPNDLVGLAVRWKDIATQYGITAKAEVTQLQLTNAIAGKGANRAKANGLSVGNLSELWPIELLKLAGYLRIAAPIVVQGDAKDRKTYILRPRDVEIHTLTRVMADFRAVLWATTAVKLDVLAALRFAEVFLHFRWERLQTVEAEEEEDAIVSATAFVHGFDVTFSKNLGNAVATMNLATINLPGWLPEARELDGTTRALALVKEHIKIVQAIGNRGPGKPAEEGSEEHDLLRHYRDFLSARGDLTAFFAFSAAYGSYVLAQRYRKRTAFQFSIAHLEVLMTPSNFREITSNPGFQRIATCIRRATVFPQYRASQHNDKRYEVRYGLGQELARTARDNKEFLIALGEFIRSYCAETAREEEKLAQKLGRRLTGEDRRTYALRPTPRVADLDAVVGLVDQDRFGAQVVCPLLLAYGYASTGPAAGTSAGTAGDPTADPDATASAADAEDAGDE